jgi:hypothetical protein
MNRTFFHTDIAKKNRRQANNQLSITNNNINQIIPGQFYEQEKATQLQTKWKNDENMSRSCLTHDGRWTKAVGTTCIAEKICCTLY